MGHVKAVLQKRNGKGKSQVIPSPMPKPRATPEALITSSSVKAKINDIARRRRQANGNILLMPQAESVQEDAGGLGYAAPSTGNGNYALSLPAGTGTTDKNKAIKQAHKTVPKVTQQSDTGNLDGLKEDVITSLEDLEPILEAYRKTKVIRSTATKGMADDAGILESALELGALHGLRGHELPADHVKKKFGVVAHLYHKGLEQGRAERARRAKPKKGILSAMTEDLKVGEGNDGDASSDSPRENRVKRKYLGTKRGRTATGKTAHAIEVMPVIARPDKNVNKTTPGSPLKRTT